MQINSTYSSTSKMFTIENKNKIAQFNKENFKCVKTGQNERTVGDF